MTERPPAQGNLVNCKRRRRGSVGWVPNWDYSWVDGGVGGGQGKQFKLAKRKLVLMMMWLLLLPGIQSIYFLLLTVAYGRTANLGQLSTLFLGRQLLNASSVALLLLYLPIRSIS